MFSPVHRTSSCNLSGYENNLWSSRTLFCREYHIQQASFFFIFTLLIWSGSLMKCEQVMRKAPEILWMISQSVFMECKQSFFMYSRFTVIAQKRTGRGTHGGKLEIFQLSQLCILNTAPLIKHSEHFFSYGNPNLLSLVFHIKIKTYQPQT